MQLPKSYFLPPYRSIVIGIIFIIMGLCLTFIGIDLNASVGKNLQRIFLSFSSIGDFSGSLIILLFKAGFIAGGYFFIKYANGVERARLDDEGFHYREIPKGSGVSKLAMDVGRLSFVPYNAIVDVYFRDSFFSGRQLFITLNSGPIALVALGVLKKQEKQEIVDVIKSKIGNRINSNK